MFWFCPIVCAIISAVCVEATLQAGAGPQPTDAEILSVALNLELNSTHCHFNKTPLSSETNGMILENDGGVQSVTTFSSLENPWSRWQTDLAPNQSSINFETIMMKTVYFYLQIDDLM